MYGKSIKSDAGNLHELNNISIYHYPNLHAKIYVNESKMIIGSMNFSAVSETDNTELGVLLTKAADAEAFAEALNHCQQIVKEAILEFNGTDGHSVGNPTVAYNNTQAASNASLYPDAKSNWITEFENNLRLKHKNDDIEYCLNQQWKAQALYSWRDYKGFAEDKKPESILTTSEIDALVAKKGLDAYSVYDILPKYKAKKYAEEISDAVQSFSSCNIAYVINTVDNRNNDFYSTVKIKMYPTNKTFVLYTTRDLPEKARVVAVEINKTWFNDWLYLDI